MAKDKDAEITLEDEGTVIIDVSDDPNLQLDTEKDGDEDEGKAPEPKKPIERKRLNDQEPVKAPAVDEATQALTAAKKQAEDETKLRQAAEATAASERSRREAAEARANQHQQEAEDARTTAEKTQLSLLEQGLDSAKNEVTNYEAQLATAYESGDFKAVAAVQTKLSTAAAKVDRLSAAQEELANRKPTTEGRVEHQQPQHGNAFEQYVAQFAPEAQTWIRAHPECAPTSVGGQASANSKMMAGHYSALAQNITPNTTEYFRVIEEHAGYRQPVSAAAQVTKADEAEPPVKAPQQRKPPVAAPPSREPPQNNGLPRNQRTVTLTKDEQDMAKLSFPTKTPQEAFAMYARNKLDLEAEGKLGRTTH